MRRAASATPTDEPRRRHLGSGIKRAKPSSESSDQIETLRPRRMLDKFGLHSPTQSALRSDKLVSFALKEIDKAAERSGLISKLRSEGPADCHVLNEGVANGAHCTPPAAGQGRATPRNDSKDTFA